MIEKTVVRVGLCALLALGGSCRSVADRVESLRAAAAEHADEGLIEEAINVLDEALVLTPGAPVLLAERAHIHYDNRRFEKALRDYQAAVEADPTYTDGYYNIGVSLENLGRSEQADAQFTRFIELRPQDAAGPSRRAHVRSRMGKLEGALADVERAIELGADPASLSLLRVQLLRRSERYPEAHAHLDGLMQADPNSAELAFELGLQELDLGELESAIAAFQAALDNGATGALRQSSLFNIGIVHRRSEKWNDALGVFQAYAAESPSDSDGLYNLALAHFELGRWSEALVALERTLELIPDDWQANWKRGQSLLASEQYALARDAFGAILEKDPGNAHAHFNRAIAHHNSGEMKLAAADYSAYLQSYPEDIDSLFNRARVLHADKKQALALADMQRVVELDPEYASAYEMIGKIYNALEEHENSANAYSRALELAPESYEAFHGRGRALRRAGRYQEALSDFDRSLALFPGAYGSMFQRAMCLEELDRPKGAIETYTRYIEGKPTHDGEVYARRGYQRIRVGEAKKAIADFDEALARGFEEAWVHYYRGRTNRALGRLAEAKTDCDNAIALNPSDGSYFSVRSELRHALGDFDGALEDALESLELSPNAPDAMRAAVRAGASAGTQEQREWILDRVADHRAGNRDEFASYATLLSDQGYLEAAIGQLDGALALAPGDEQLLGERARLFQHYISEKTAILQERTESLRGLAVGRALVPKIVTPDQAEQILAANRAKHETASERETLQRTLVRLGFIGPEVDYHAISQEGRMQYLAGFYDDADKELYLVQDESAPRPLYATLTTLSHEFAHALDDKAFDLVAIKGPAPTWDEAAAFYALVEGSASVTDRAFELGGAEAVFALQPADIRQESRSFRLHAVSHMPGPALAIPLLVEDAVFRYADGFAFCLALPHTEDLWSGINHAFRSPPRSTEQILHPEKYSGDQRDEPTRFARDKAAGSPVPQWEVLSSNVLGELRTELLLRPFAGIRKARKAAVGWGGDRYWIFEIPGSETLVLTWATVWDTEGDASEFTIALDKQYPALEAQAADARNPVNADERSSRAGRLVSARWQAGNAVYLIDGCPQEEFEAVRAWLVGLERSTSGD